MEPAAETSTERPSDSDRPTRVRFTPEQQAAVDELIERRLARLERKHRQHVERLLQQHALEASMLRHKVEAHTSVVGRLLGWMSRKDQ